MKNNPLFPLNINPNIKGKMNTRSLFKEERKEEDKHSDMKEKDNSDFQVAFQTEIQDESWLWNFRCRHQIFCGIKLLHRKNIAKGFPLIDKPKRVFEGCIFGKHFCALSYVWPNETIIHGWLQLFSYFY